MKKAQGLCTIGLFVGVLSLGTLTSTAQEGCACPRSKGYWKQHVPETANECVKEIMAAPVRGNAAVTLAQQLFSSIWNFYFLFPPATEFGINCLDEEAAAELNATRGAAVSLIFSLPDGVCGVISADVRPNSTDGQEMLALSEILEQFNEGLYNPACSSDEAP